MKCVKYANDLEKSVRELKHDCLGTCTLKLRFRTLIRENRGRAWGLEFRNQVLGFKRVQGLNPTP